MFSSLPAIADKTFVIAYLVPTLAFGLAVGVAFPELGLNVALASEKSIGDLTFVAAAIWFAALTLLLVNRPIYRAFEGYAGPLASAELKQQMQQRWEDEMNALRRLYRALTGATGEAADDANAAYNASMAKFRRCYPRDKADVLGTRFGNINRAFEVYAENVYGVQGIVIWPRLSGVMPSAFQTVLSDARSQVDCFLNLTALALLFAVLELGRWAISLGYGLWLGWPTADVAPSPSVIEMFAATDWNALLVAPCSILFAWLTYRMLLDRTLALGEQVKSAFDLYLGALPAQLGYELPATADEQDKFWRALRRSYSYFDRAPDEYRPKKPGKAPSEASIGSLATAARRLFKL